MRESFFLFLANHLPRFAFFDKVRFILYCLAGMKVKGKSMIWGPLIIRPLGGARNIEIGKDVFINTDIRFGVPKDKVIIGNRVQIGPKVMFETVSHGLVYREGVGRGTSTKPIIVEDEVWIGGGSIITQGVKIGKGAVVAAGSLVNSDVEQMTLVGGVPAKVIRKINDES